MHPNSPEDQNSAISPPLPYFEKPALNAYASCSCRNAMQQQLSVWCQTINLLIIIQSYAVWPVFGIGMGISYIVKSYLTARMNPKSKQQILQLLSLESMISEYMREPVVKSNRGISNIQRRSKKTQPNDISSYSTLQAGDNRPNKRALSSQNIGKRTLENPKNSKLYHQSGKLRPSSCIKINKESLASSSNFSGMPKREQSHKLVGKTGDKKSQNCQSTNLMSQAKGQLPCSKQPKQRVNSKVFKTSELFNQSEQLEDESKGRQMIRLLRNKVSSIVEGRSEDEEQQTTGASNTEPMNINTKLIRKYMPSKKNQNISQPNMIFGKKKQVVLKGRYQLQKIIGRGLSGVVYKAKDILADRFVAIKVISPNNVEYQFIKQLDHPNLIKYYNSFVETESKGAKQQRYLVLEYLPMNLSEVVRKHFNTDKLNGQALKKVFKAVCSGVLYLHSLSFAHRDIKLENIVCSEDLESVKFIDFGLCLDMSDMDAKESQRFCGTVLYMAPETISGSCIEPKKADIWSLGVALYVLKFGRAPFKGRQEVEIYKKIKNNKTIFPNDLEESLKDLLDKMLQKNPEDRPSIFEVLHHRWLSQ